MKMIYNEIMADDKKKIKTSKIAHPGIPLTWENIEEAGILSKTKIAIAKSKRSTVVISGGKGAGKTVIPEIKAALKFETDSYFNAFGFRKYKESASDKLSSYFTNALNLLKMAGFELKRNYRTSRNKTFRLTSPIDMYKNQKFEYGSLDNVTGSTDGAAPTNGGYYGLALVDEPVVKEDIANPDNIPSDKEWDETMSIMDDNLGRYNDNYETFSKRKAFFQTFMCMNPWGDHPIIKKLNARIPDEKFIKYIFQGYTLKELFGEVELIEELFENKDFTNGIMECNTMQYDDEELDTLWVKVTKFSNPNNWKPKNSEKIMRVIKDSLISKDINALMIVLGLKHQGYVKNDMLVYNLEEKHWQLAKVEEMLEKGYQVSRVVYSWDIDTSRVLTLTPGILMHNFKYNREKQKYVVNDERIILDKQIELKAKGTGPQGEMLDVYTKEMFRVTKRHYERLKGLSNESKPDHVTIAIDDKRKWFLRDIKKMNPEFINRYKTFDQHGEYDTEFRQDLMMAGVRSGKIINHPDNIELMNDMQYTVKRDIKDPRRKTSGSTNYLDRIDSAENAFIPFARIIKVIISAEKKLKAIKRTAEGVE